MAEFPTVHIKERSFKPMMVIKKKIDGKCLTDPWEVAVNNSNEIFVSDLSNNRILVFNEKGEFIRSFGQNLVSMPTGISIDNEGRAFVANGGNKYFVCDSENKRVKFLSPDGNLLKTVGKYRLRKKAI